MPKTTAHKTPPPCGGQNCRCHDYNALLALALWDYVLARRRKIPN